MHNAKRAMVGISATVLVLVATITPWAIAPAGAAVPVAVTTTSFTTDEDTAITTTIDFDDPDGGELLEAAYVPPDNGQIGGGFNAPTGLLRFTYTPGADWNGTELISIRVTDDQDESTQIYLTITVTPVDDPYTANNDTFIGDEDTAITGNVMDNDVDPDGDVTVSLDIPPASGDITLNPDGSFTFTPDSNFHGPDSFTYSGSDDTHNSSATVALTVNSVDDPAQFVGTHPTVLEDGSVTAALDVVDPDGFVQSAGIVDNGDLGSATLEDFNPGIPAEVVYGYRPSPDNNGTDEVTIRVTDSSGGETDHTETIEITPVNDAPVADDGSYAGNAGTPIDVTAIATDVDGDTLSYVPTFELPDHGEVTGSDGLGNFTYTADPDFSGTDTLTFQVDDGNGGTDTATITFTINGTPLVDDTTIAGTEDTALPVDVHDLAADPDHTNGDLTYTIVTPPTAGNLLDDTPRDTTDSPFTYTPDPDFDGTDTFKLQACDPDGLCDTGTITIDLAAVNDAPVVDDDTIAATVDEDDTITGDIPVTDPDNTDDDFTYTISTEAEHGTATPGSFAYTPDSDFHGTDTFAVTVCDPGGACDTATIDVTVIPVNDAPAGTDDSITATVDDTVTLEAPISDVDGDALTYTWTQTSGPPVQLAGVDQPAAVFVAGETGTHTFEVTACDPDGKCTTNTITVNVTEPQILPITGATLTTVGLTGLALILTGLALAHRNRYRPRHLRRS